MLTGAAQGYTYAKPEISTPGRSMVGPVPDSSTLATSRPDDMVAPGYEELSGTSFAAPVVAGTVAYLLALNPKWKPDQLAFGNATWGSAASGSAAAADVVPDTP